MHSLSSSRCLLFIATSCYQILLEGEANDYVGKGMHGGSIALVPPSELLAKNDNNDNNDNNENQFLAHENVICGNTCLYGATGGSFHAYGRTGERFAVRNSGALAVVEGAGDHCCEYMTNGVVGVLGTTGRNVGAGMTGGLAFFLGDDAKNGQDFAIKVSIVLYYRIYASASWILFCIFFVFIFFTRVSLWVLLFSPQPTH